MCGWSLALGQTWLGGATKGELPIATGQQERIRLHFALPSDVAPGKHEIKAAVQFSNGEAQKDSFTINVLPKAAAVPVSGKIAIFDPKGETTKLLATMGIENHVVEPGADLSAYDILIVGKAALTVDGPGPNLSRVRDGLKVVVFEQTSEALEKRLGFRVAEYGLRQVFPRIPDHPLLAGLKVENLHDWRGSATLLPPRLEHTAGHAFEGPAVEWCGIEVPHVWRCGNRGNVASVLIEKPARGDFLPVLDGGYSLQYSPLMEYREGKGMVLFCQLDVTGRTEQDPAAETLAGNVLRYVAGWKPPARREALYVGGPVGRRYLEFSGIRVKSYEGGKLPPDHVLIVAAGDGFWPRLPTVTRTELGLIVHGGGWNLADSAAAIAEFLKAGGHLLCLGLDEEEARTFLPFKVGMTKAEHIAAFFEPPPASSLLSGVAPSDMHNRDPQKLPLVSSGATVLGDGVLAQAENAHVVFYQFPPYTVTSAEGEAPSFAVDGHDAVEGKQSALVTMGMTAGGGTQFGQSVKVAPQVGKTYTFAACLKGVGGPVLAHLEVERAGSPWDRAVKGGNVMVPENEWTDLHVTFKCQTPFPEGWQAYVGCAQEGARYRADLFRLYEGDYVPWKASAPRAGVGIAAGPKNLFVNAGFESGQKPWFFMFNEQLNLRRTYRRTSVALTRLLANMGVSAATPLLSRFSLPVGGDQPQPGASVVRNGDFRQAARKDAAPDQWEFSSESRQATCTRQPMAGNGGWALQLVLGSSAGKDQATVMLAQQDVPVKDAQWYRISLRAKAEGMAGKTVQLALQNTKTWNSLFDYQSFTPAEEWHTFRFLVQANGTAERNTRFQIWHGNTGTLWLADVSMAPVAPPSSEGRWSQGLYLDQPEAWDDPYRFFRW